MPESDPEQEGLVGAGPSRADVAGGVALPGHRLFDLPLCHQVEEPALVLRPRRAVLLVVVKHLLRGCQTSSNPYLYIVVVLALSTGARKMELLNLPNLW